MTPEARNLLLRAADICAAGWCKGREAENYLGEPISMVSPPPPNAPTVKEMALSPVRFSVGAAMFRAIARQAVPKGMQKEKCRLLYLSVDDAGQDVLGEAVRAFCRTAGVMHPADWNDRRCKSGDEAAAMLRLAAGHG